MKITLLLFFCYLTNCFSQNIKGKVLANNLPINNVEVINTSSKEVVNTNLEGVFEIKATTGNWITFYHKNYEVVKVYVDSLFDYNSVLEIKLYEKSTKIDVVVVEKKQPFLKGLKTEMPVISNNKPKVQFNDGSIPNGMNFMKIGKMLIGLFKNKDKAEIKAKVPVEFKSFTAQSYTTDFLVTNLKLKTDEMEEFLNFCNFDPKSKEAVENSDKLMLLQFLMTKSEEFKTLHRKE